jgi:cobyrinic acid a,c-diamide synthase
MYLCRELEDHQGRLFPMAGCFPFKVRMLPRLKTLGYREVQLQRRTIIGEEGALIRGHEYHYSEIVAGFDPGETVYRIADRRGRQTANEGYMIQQTLGSYIHLHFGSAPAAAEAFVGWCRAYGAERKKIDASA